MKPQSILFSFVIVALSAYGSTKGSSDVCQLGPEPGPCKAYFERFYYSATEGKCKEFIYGGCQGNQNNFETLEDCESACSEHEDKSPPQPPPFECGEELCFHGKCIEKNNKKECQCFPGCPRIYYPVCGSDEKTYPNECEMKSASCRGKEWIYKTHYGKCLIDAQKTSQRGGTQ